MKMRIGEEIGITVIEPMEPPVPVLEPAPETKESVPA
jgi:hypothetical protein